MLFEKKSKKSEVKCSNCNSKTNKGFSFCPHCGHSLINKEKEMQDFGILGKSDAIEEDVSLNVLGSNMGIPEKFINSLMNTLMKSLGQMKDSEKTEVKSFPNGIKIRIGTPSFSAEPERPQEPAKKQVREITEEQLEKMSTLPRATAKTSVKRLNNKIIYEINAPGIRSVRDIFISKVESGYEIKAIGNKKVYINSLPVNLQLENMSFDNKKLFLEFKNQEE